MQFTIAIFALLAAVAIALPVDMEGRSDTAPAMTNSAKQVVPFDSAAVVTTPDN